MTKKRIFISGASGFIGTHLCRRLALDKDADVRALVRSEGELPRGIQKVVGDLHAVETYAESLLNCDVYVHLAGVVDINASLENPRIKIEENVALLSNVLELLRTRKKQPLIIFASTDRVYGATKKSIVSETEPAVPIEPYTAAKIICETLLATYQRMYSIPYIILRLDSVYGPGQPRSMFISDVIQKMMENDTITVGNLAIRKNFVYVDDVVEAIVACGKASEKDRNTIYNIGGPSTSLKNLARIIKKEIEVRFKKKIVVVSSQESFRPSRIEVRPFKLSTAKAHSQLAWTPKTSITAGLKTTIDSFSKI